MADLPKLPRKFLFEFIALYKAKSCLWQITSPDYINKTKRKSAYNELLTKLREFEPGATEDIVKKKISSLRTVFRREHTKVCASKCSGLPADEVYSPRLYYYESLLFLIDQTTVPYVTDTDNIEGDCDKSTEDLSLIGSDDDLNDYSAKREEPKSTGVTGRLHPNEYSKRSWTSKKKSSRRRRKEQAIRILTGEFPKQVVGPLEYENFGKHVAEEMRKLPKQQAIFLSKIINEGIFEAQCGLLTSQTTIVCDPNDHTNSIE